LKDKSETQRTLKIFLRLAQNEFDLRIKKIRCDNNTEFKNLEVKEYLEEEGTKHVFSTPYTPHQNGVLERKNMMLVDMTRTILKEYKMSDRFLVEDVNIAYHTINRLYLYRLLKKTSYEPLSDNKPNI
jgi:IS30 family transposase